MSKSCALADRDSADFSMTIPAAAVPPRLETFARGLACDYSNERWPEEEVYSIVADAVRVGGRIAKTYADPSCVELSQDELEAEMRRKMVELLHGRPAEGKRQEKRPLLEWVKSRQELFKYLTTCFSNQTKGLVHRHRFTAKRTGSKVPPKGSPELARWGREQQKPEISLDENPELRSRREFQTVGGGTGSQTEIDSDMAESLSPLEFIVWQQMTDPNEMAWLLANLDASRGRSAMEVKITFDHYAQGVGLSVEEFTRIAREVSLKFEEYRNSGSDAVARLSPVSADRRSRLTSVEFLVYQQLVAPNARSRAVAQVEGVAPQWGHLAYGVGMPVEMFKLLSTTVKNKLMEKDLPAIATLEEVFEVQVPRSAEALLVRRLFTLAARAKVERVTPEVADLLRTIGAEPPEVNAQDNLTCFGVLFAKNHHVCQVCQVRKACSVRAANFGLDQVSLHPQLLPARAYVRTAQVVGQQLPAPLSKNAPRSEREEEIGAYLEHHFRRVASLGGKITYAHRSQDISRSLVMVLREKDAFRVRFCSPSVALQESLIRRGVEFFAHDESDASTVCSLLGRHADELFAEEMAARAQRAVEPTVTVPEPVGESLEVPMITVTQISQLMWTRARYLSSELFDRLVVRPLHFKRPR